MDPSYNNNVGPIVSPPTSGESAAPVSSPASVPQAPIMPAGGDIILQPDASAKRGGNKKTKWLIIGGIIALVIAAGLGIAAVMTNNNNSSEVSTESDEDTMFLAVSDEAQAAFNAYANYLFYGNTEKESFVPIEAWGTVNMLTNAVNNINQEWQANYFTQARTLFDEFVSLAELEYPQEKIEEMDDELGAAAQRMWMLIGKMQVGLPALVEAVAEENVLEDATTNDETAGGELQEEETADESASLILSLLGSCVNLYELFGGQANG